MLVREQMCVRLVLLLYPVESLWNRLQHPCITCVIVFFTIGVHGHCLQVCVKLSN